MTPDITLLTPADRKLLATLTGDILTKTRLRIAAVQQVASAPAGTKNRVMTALSDELGVTIGGVNMFCMNFRKGGLAAILPRGGQVAAASRGRP